MSNSNNLPKTRKTGRVSQDEVAIDKSVPGSDQLHSKQYSDTNKVTDKRFEQAPEDNTMELGKGRRGRGQKTHNPTKSPQKKSRKDINSIADFIAYAYSRKGQRLSLKSKEKKAMRERSKLDDESLRWLLELAKEDVLLAVPRQILLTVLEMEIEDSSSSLRSQAKDFVKDILNRHPVFSIPEIKGILNNLDHTPDPKSALAVLSKTDYSRFPELTKGKTLKPKDYETLRVNAIYSLAVWFVETRKLSLEKINQYLFEVLWQPKNKPAENGIACLQRLTNISDLSGVGAACSIFKQQLDQQKLNYINAKNKEESALEQLHSLESSYNKLQRELEERDRKIAELHKSLEMEKQDHKNTRIHLKDDLENLRSRLLRCLKEEIILLDEGLHALRRNPPKIRVMEDHAERVLDRLKKEIKELVG